MASRPQDIIQIPTGIVSVPSLGPEPGKVVSLPAPVSRLIGRDDELAGIAAICLAPEVRLVTLTGPGGIGKTRIAVATAHSLTGAFDRIVYVPLVTVTDPAQVADAIARRLAIREKAGGSIAESLPAALLTGRSLLVIDNMEHVIAAAGLIANLLQQCPGLHVLATSRVPLGIAGEHERAIPALALPTATSSLPDAEELVAYGAIDLFLERVRAFQPGFSLDGSQASDVVEICRQLDGLPLAIELAAARLRILSPASLRSRLGSRLAVLTGGGPDQAAHQRTVRSTIAWSYDLLAPTEQALFRRLAVFAGSFTIESAESLDQDDTDILETLLGLVNQNLVRRELLADGSVRFRMLATIREFALERLAASPEASGARQRFAESMATLVELASPHLTDHDRVSWSQRLDLEHPNILATLEWLEDIGQTDTLLDMLVRLQPFWQMRGRFDIGQGWLSRGIVAAERSPGLTPELRARTYLASGRLALAHGDHDTVAAHANQALEIAQIAGAQPVTADTLTLLGMLAYRLTTYGRAREHATAALEIYKKLGNEAGIAASLHALATITMDSGDLAAAEQFYLQAIDAFNQAGDVHGAVISSDNLGVLLYSRNEVARAAALTTTALEVFRSLQDVRRTAIALDHLGKCARRLGNLDESWRAHRESLAIRLEFGDPRGLAVWLEAVAALLAARNDSPAAAKLLGAAAALRAAHNLPLHGNESIEHEHVMNQLEQALGAATLESHLTDGRLLSPSAAITLATEIGDQMPASPAPTSVDPLAHFELTAREREVLDLVIDRLSDREIADALFISPRTVARHLAGIFAKLDVHSRREAADLARSLGDITATG